MDIEINEVQEIIKNLEIGSELSIKEEKYLKIAKLCVQLAALFGVKTPGLPPLEHENAHYADAAEMEIEALRQRIAELEEAEQKLCAANITLDARAELAERQLAEMESRTVKIPYLPDDCDRTEAHYKYQAALRDAAIKVEAE